jgi:hypothetical protein
VPIPLGDFREHAARRVPRLFVFRRCIGRSRGSRRISTQRYRHLLRGNGGWGGRPREGFVGWFGSRGIWGAIGGEAGSPSNCLATVVSAWARIACKAAPAVRLFVRRRTPPRPQPRRCAMRLSVGALRLASWAVGVERVKRSERLRGMGSLIGPPGVARRVASRLPEHRSFYVPARRPQRLA